MPELPPPVVSATPPGGFSFQPPWSEVTSISEGRHRVRLGGFFGPMWMASLCKGMAEHRLSIQRAHAIRARNQSWVAEFVVQALEGADAPESLPYVEFTLPREESDVRAIVVRSFELVETEDHNGTLRLVIDADDTLGFLGALLSQLAELLLFPVEMHIDTLPLDRGVHGPSGQPVMAGLAHDCLWLSALGVERPQPEARDALRGILERAVVR